jgi:hypothetical protein
MDKISAELSVESINIDTLIPYAMNARTHDEMQVAQIAASIREFGFNNPVLVDPDNGIIAGHGRVLAAQKLKLDTVPCIRLGHLSDAQKRAFILADNRLAMSAGWDDEILKSEPDRLRQEDFDIDLIGFDDSELKAFFDKESEGEEYTRKIKAPLYEPTGEKPDLLDLFSAAKTNQLLSEIESSNVTDEEKAFLRVAAQRHTVFSYKHIAEYYSHADAEMQSLMEDSALIIIDFEKAIENGFVTLAGDIAEACLDDESNI